MHDRLKDAQKQTNDLTTHVNDVEEQERLRQTSNLYEELGQELSALMMDLWLLRQKSKKIGRILPHSTLFERLTATSRLIDTTIQSVRKISRDIKPLIIDEVGVAAAIEWQLQEFEQRKGISFVLNSSIGNVSLDREISTTLFRILQLILMSIESYGTATRVDISLQKDRDNFLIMQVTDNGKGITERKIADSQSLTLLIMHERARLHGGDLLITDSPTRGTRFFLKIPLTLRKKELN